MKYYRFKKVITKYTTLSIVTNDNVYFYNDTLCGLINDLDLSIQFPECEVIEVSFDNIQKELEQCYFNKDINNSIVKNIREYYSVDEELKLTKRAIVNPLDSEYLAMQSKIQEIKDTWNIVKRSMGLIQ